MIRRPPRSTLSSSSAASDVYKRQFRWRALVWGIVLVLLEAAISPIPETGSWPRWYIPIAFTALLQTPLLIGVRHWPWLWFVVYSVAQSIAFRIEHSTFGHTAWVRLLSLGLGLSGESAQAVVVCAPQMMAAAILGLALICLMPPIKDKPDHQVYRRAHS